jgi:hypothetical protein
MSTGANRSLGVDWYLPTPKGSFATRRFATTTVASARLIELLAADGLTWAEIATRIHFDSEALRVATGFVNAGFGDAKAAEHVTTGGA